MYYFHIFNTGVSPGFHIFNTLHISIETLFLEKLYIFCFKLKIFSNGILYFTVTKLNFGGLGAQTMLLQVFKKMVMHTDLRTSQLGVLLK